MHKHYTSYEMQYSMEMCCEVSLRLTNLIRLINRTLHYTTKCSNYATFAIIPLFRYLINSGNLAYDFFLCVLFPYVLLTDTAEKMYGGLRKLNGLWRGNVKCHGFKHFTPIH